MSFLDDPASPPEVERLGQRVGEQEWLNLSFGVCGMRTTVLKRRGNVN